MINICTVLGLSVQGRGVEKFARVRTTIRGFTKVNVIAGRATMMGVETNTACKVSLAISARSISAEDVTTMKLISACVVKRTFVKVAHSYPIARGGN